MKTKTFETKTFLICDDKSPNYYTGRFTRKPSEIKESLNRLKIGESYSTSATVRITREA